MSRKWCRDSTKRRVSHERLHNAQRSKIPRQRKRPEEAGSVGAQGGHQRHHLESEEREDRPKEDSGGGIYPPGVSKGMARGQVFDIRAGQALGMPAPRPVHDYARLRSRVARGGFNNIGGIVFAVNFKAAQEIPRGYRNDRTAGLRTKTGIRARSS